MAVPSSSTTIHDQPIVVVGGGLAGSMTALLLSKHNNANIIVLESRNDFRVHERVASENRLTDSLKRSINLALSYRGISALKRAGVFSAVEQSMIAMQSRVVHMPSGSISVQPYGTGDQAINSISRSDLNRLLLDELDKQSNTKCLFDCKLQRIDSNGTVYYTDKSKQSHTINARFVVGADGAYSQVRASLQRLTRVDFSMQYIKHGYKELTIPAASSGDYALSNPNGLHIWPRHEFMLIALPNPDKSFTCTLFAPFDGADGLDNVNSDDEIITYFNKYFSDVIPLMPDLLNDYKQSPNSPLISVRTAPWIYKDKIVILGDAAHACVPFYGQGMNAAFEDALLLDEIYQSKHGNPAETLFEFNKQRVAAGHALCDLSLDNYIEMRSKTANPLFIFKKKIESMIHWCIPNTWVPLYTMVAFTRTPYDECIRKGKQHDRILNIGLTTLATSIIATTTALALNYLPQQYKQKLHINTLRLNTSNNTPLVAQDFRTRLH